MTKGKVLWWNDSKGFGFIRQPLYNPSGLETASRDVFAHFTAIQGEGFKTLKEGETVEFDLYESPKGFTALNIRKVES